MRHQKKRNKLSRDAGQRKATTFKAVTRTIAPGTTATLRLATPRALLKALQKAQRRARSHRVTRKPTLTLTNTATGGKSTLKPKIVVKRKR